MSQTLEFIQNAYMERELLIKNAIEPFPPRAFDKFNIVIGKNGSGKSRMIKFLRELGIKNNCLTISLDFAKEILKDKNREGHDIIDSIVYQSDLNADTLYDLFNVAEQQKVNAFEYLEKLWSDRPNIVEDKLNQINQKTEVLINRRLLMANKRLCIYNIKTNQKRLFDEEIKFLSPGENNLLVLAVVLLCIKIKQKQQALILIDEIESHLHPAVLLQVFEMIRDLLDDTNSCVFIATHSIFLLPFFEFNGILYMENGKLTKLNGKIYPTIIDNLLYGTDEKGALVEFFASYDEWAYAQYLSECFLPPTTVGTVNTKDIQYLKFCDIVQDVSTKERKLQILDYGAGEGRIGQCIELDSRKEVFQSKISYSIYDKYVKPTKFDSGKGIYGYIFKNEKELEKNKGSMDIVLLYNVLHEISIEDWTTELNRAISMLAPNGRLIFSERKTLSAGEKPYGKSGYLLLGENETKILFGDMEVTKVILEKTIKDVTICFAIRNSSHATITEEKVKLALEALKDRVRVVIDKNLEGNEDNKLKAREYAFYCQQYFNVDNALKLLEKNCKEEHVREYKDLMYILNDERLSNHEKRMQIEKRSLLDDAEGKKCRKYLKDNP